MSHPLIKRRYGCKWGKPHDLILLHDGKQAKWERCQICNKTFRWTKGFKGRIKNVDYLEAHARNYAQPNGATNELYKRLYEPEKCKIVLS